MHTPPVYNASTDDKGMSVRTISFSFSFLTVVLSTLTTVTMEIFDVLAGFAAVER